MAGFINALSPLRFQQANSSFIYQILESKKPVALAT
ncbi:MAG: hypothetical protein ACI9N3_001729, partial [Colwellia sp.]